MSMNLPKRTHNFLLYMELKNHWDDLQINDLKWMVEYLEERIDYYLSPEGRNEVNG